MKTGSTFQRMSYSLINYHLEHLIIRANSSKPEVGHQIQQKTQSKIYGKSKPSIIVYKIAKCLRSEKVHMK